jgi:thioredoxin reductase (NADPH)
MLSRGGSRPTAAAARVDGEPETAPTMPTAASTAATHETASGSAASVVLPVLFVVDHDRRSLDVLLTDLSGRFGNDFAVLGESSPTDALAALDALATAQRQVALLLVDDANSDFLARAHKLYPSAARVLLVDRDYSSTSPAVAAIALGRADYHIVRPWTDDEMMYRAMSGYLASWEKEQEPNFELFRIVAEEGDSRVLVLRDVMARFSMPAAFYAAESESGRRLLVDAGLDASQLPAVIRYDGQVMIDPSLPDLAHAVGVNITNDVERCELAIVGAGPAGLTAAVYAASEGLETVLLERAVSGGQAGTSPMIRNYPGFPHGISGGLLMERTCEQAWLMGAHIVFAQQAVGLERDGDERIVRLRDGSEVRARSVVIATGIEWRRLGVPSLEALVGAGVFYGAAVSESRAMQDQEVFIVGAGNSAGQAALHLAKHARTVTLVVRGESLPAAMSSYLVRAIEATANVVVRYRTEVVDGGGDGQLEHLALADRASGAVTNVAAAALFTMIGGEPHTRWLPDEIARDASGYLITGRELLDAPGVRWSHRRAPLALETSVPGVFAAGDVRQGSIKRVASGVGEGATVVRLVHEHLSDIELASASAGGVGAHRASRPTTASRATAPQRAAAGSSIALAR